MKITGTEFNYFHICKRKLWLFSHGIEMEQESDNVLLGKLIHEHSYERKKKEILIDGAIRIDFIDEEAVHEVKKSNRMEDSHIGQLLYYIYCLRKKGVDIRKGIINYPKQRRTTEVELTEDRESEIEDTIFNIREIKSAVKPMDVLDTKICRKCGYEEFCYA